MSEKKSPNIFSTGPIAPSFIAESITKHSTKMSIGAHQIFLGQVRQDEVNGKLVSGIEYTAYEAMVSQKLAVIREEIFERYCLSCLHVHHSLGFVKAGEICLFVFTSSAHRRAAMDACAELVERIKKELPIWGKEFFEDETDQWKVNQ
jgi:molybdopterin synthase catalytic subunit